MEYPDASQVINGRNGKKREKRVRVSSAMCGWKVGMLRKKPKTTYYATREHSGATALLLAQSHIPKVKVRGKSPEGILPFPRGLATLGTANPSPRMCPLIIASCTLHPHRPVPLYHPPLIRKHTPSQTEVLIHTQENEEWKC